MTVLTAQELEFSRGAAVREWALDGFAKNKTSVKTSFFSTHSH